MNWAQVVGHMITQVLTSKYDFKVMINISLFSMQDQ